MHANPRPCVVLNDCSNETLQSPKDLLPTDL
jgi:hypothetical protein